MSDGQAPTIPESLDWLRSSTEGREWIVQLPELLSSVCRDWSLTPGQPLTGGSCALVLPVTTPADIWHHDPRCRTGNGGTRTGLDAVLKLQFPGRESEHEADALRAWAGRGAIRLLGHDPRRHALLLERCHPGTPLSVLDPDEALPVLADLVAELSVPATGQFTSLSEEAARWAQNLPTTWERAGRPFERDLVDRALDLLEHLASSQGPQVLVHQDLHGDNVLRARRGPWLAIDPKPITGEIEFAAAPIVRSSELGHNRSAVLRRLDHLADTLDLDRDRALGWSIAQTMAWCFRDDLSVLPGHLDVVRWLGAE